MIMITHWTPLACLSGLAKYEATPQDEKLRVALVVINMPLDGMMDKFKNLWKTASVKACTDGGTNQVYRIAGDQPDRDQLKLMSDVAANVTCSESSQHNDFINDFRRVPPNVETTSPTLFEQYLPDYISGDFDSIAPDILSFYKEKGVEVISTPDQDETDLTKCLRILLSKQNINEFDQIVVVNAFGRRLDQTMANIETLFHVEKITSKPVYLMSEDSMACLLLPGKHVIHASTGFEGDWCGLIPIGAKCTRITTTGLKWNLTDGQLEFGGLVSTSNSYNGSEAVTIETDTAILWTMGVKEN